VAALVILGCGIKFDVKITALPKLGSCETRNAAYIKAHALSAMKLRTDLGRTYGDYARRGRRH